MHRTGRIGVAAAGETEILALGLADDGAAGIENTGDDGRIDIGDVAFQRRLRYALTAQLLTMPGIYLLNSELVDRLPRSPNDWRDPSLLNLVGLSLDRIGMPRLTEIAKASMATRAA